VGATGGILALACVLPDACVRLFELTRSGQHAQAAALQHRLVPVAKLVGSLHGVPGLKAALQLTGCDAGLPRSPLAPVSEAAMASLREALVSFEEVALV
jgi:dihydrodipicolinate synthase/N-acetylneuraminate lyase